MPLAELSHLYWQSVNYDEMQELFSSHRINHNKEKEVNQMADCIFCKIAQGEIPSTKVYEDAQVLAFRDLEPQAPEHVLVIPKKHIASVLEFSAEDSELAAHILTEVIPKIARSLSIDAGGFRLVTNTGSDGGQTVGHLHFHLLCGRPLTWPPG